MNPKQRAAWYEVDAALTHAGSLSDSASGRRSYGEYLAWLSEDEPARKALNFEKMSTGWAIGSKEFKRELITDHREAVAALKQTTEESRSLRKALWEDELTRLLSQVGRQRTDLILEGKSVGWKLAVAAALKERTTATNGWLSETLRMGNKFEVSRKVSAWARSPDRNLAKKVGLTPNPMV